MYNVSKYAADDFKQTAFSDELIAGALRAKCFRKEKKKLLVLLLEQLSHSPKNRLIKKVLTMNYHY